MSAYRFLISCARPEEHYDSLEALAERVQGLRAGRPIVLGRVALTTPGGEGPAVAVSLAEGPRVTLGYAVIGAPALPAAVQFDRLGGALARLNPEPELEDAA